MKDGIRSDASVGLSILDDCDERDAVAFTDLYILDSLAIEVTRCPDLDDRELLRERQDILSEAFAEPDGGSLAYLDLREYDICSDLPEYLRVVIADDLADDILHSEQRGYYRIRRNPIRRIVRLDRVFHTARIPFVRPHAYTHNHRLHEFALWRLLRRQLRFHNVDRRFRAGVRLRIKEYD